MDYGAARLCGGLLEQCDLCADAARALCTAVSLGSVTMVWIVIHTALVLTLLP